MANCGNGRCPHCGSCLIVEEWMLKCPRCGTVYSSELVYEHIAGRPSTYVRVELLSRRRWAGVMGVKIRGITELRQWIASKTNSQKGARDMTNYAERLARALIETGYFNEEEARALAGAFVRHYRALRHGDGLPKVSTVIEVLDSITSGRSNMEGGKYDMAIASALRRAFTTTGTYKPLIRRALRLLRIAEPSDDLVELGVGYFEELYKYLKEEMGGVEPWRYATSIAIAAAAMAKVKKLGAPPSFVRVELRIRGLENIYEELKLEKFINNIEWNSVNRETKSQQKR